MINNVIRWEKKVYSDYATVFCMIDSNTPPLRLAAIGCGGRSQTYLRLAATFPELYQVVAAADPNAVRVSKVQADSLNPDFRGFRDDQEILSVPRLADVMIIGTQDAYHVEPCLRAMQQGYDVLLEKPISPRPEEIRMLTREAAALGRRVMVCHVLRYTPFYETVKALISSGRIGEVVAVHLSEGVGPWHQAHSFVRGHWRNREQSSPMILAKSCHDLDMLSWLVNEPCLSVASFGGRHLFRSERRPDGAPEQCTQGCPLGESCAYNALHYVGKHRNWLGHVMDGAETASEKDIVQWLQISPWGRCVYACDNDAVDRQVLALEFAQGIQATFTMTAFDTGRNLEILGTEGMIRGGDFLRRSQDLDLLTEPHHGGEVERLRIPEPDGGYTGHMGGDLGLISQLDAEMRSVPVSEMKSSLRRSEESHLIAFAADRARREKRVVSLSEYR